MKRIVFVILFCVFVGSAHAGSPFGTPLKTASFRVLVLDEAGQPASNAAVEIGFNQGYGSGMIHEFETRSAITDTNGLCTLAGKCDGTLGGNVQKAGYYEDLLNNISFTNSTLTHWQPVDKLYTVVLRRILNPIPMYARDLHGVAIPAIGEPLSYDLEKGDWLPPYGNGQVADFLFHMDCQFGKQLPAGENVNEFHATLTLTFANEKDGIVEVADPLPPLEGSIFRLPRFAPETGYSNRWEMYGYETETQMGYKHTGNSESPNYFYRVRTKTNETGQIISAHYGKIRGQINFGVYAKATSLSMTYYFNPTPNDRNMEFDPERNLFTDLSPSDQVREP